MERAVLDVQALIWDDNNLAKIAAHGVEPEDVGSVLDHEPHFNVNLPGRSAEYVMLGLDKRNRFFYVPMVPTRTPGVWYAMTGYRITTRRARKIYDSP